MLSLEHFWHIHWSKYERFRKWKRRQLSLQIKRVTYYCPVLCDNMLLEVLSLKTILNDLLTINLAVTQYVPKNHAQVKQNRKWYLSIFLIWLWRAKNDTGESMASLLLAHKRTHWKHDRKHSSRTPFRVSRVSFHISAYFLKQDLRWLLCCNIYL